MPVNAQPSSDSSVIVILILVDSVFEWNIISYSSSAASLLEDADPGSDWLLEANLARGYVRKRKDLCDSFT